MEREVSIEIPIICETPGCPNKGELINRVIGIEPEDLASWYANCTGNNSSEPEDYCPLCGEPGIALDPELAQTEEELRESLSPEQFQTLMNRIQYD